MDLWQAALLGLVQGLTEFLPVSSSGHLVLVGHWLGSRAEGSGAFFEALLHVGTLIPVMWIFRQPLLGLLSLVFEPGRLWRKDAEDGDTELFWFLTVATLVTAAIALPLSDTLERLFESPTATAVGLLLTTALLVLYRFLPTPSLRRVTLVQALVVGAAQAVATVPGVSRSGTTIVAGLLVGIPLIKLGTYSMLLSVPAILGGVVLQFLRHPPPATNLVACVVGLGLAAVSGYFAVRWILACIQSRRVHWFAPYTAAVAVTVLLLTAN